MRILFVILLMGCSCIFYEDLQAAGKIIYVKADSLGENSGSSWSNAFVSLQDALNTATSVDQIWVAEGIYSTSTGIVFDPMVEDGSTADSKMRVFVVKSGTKLYGGFKGDEGSLQNRKGSFSKTILTARPVVTLKDFGNKYETTYRVLYYGTNLGPDAGRVGEINGFQIENAYSKDQVGGGLLAGDFIGPNFKVTQLNLRNLEFINNQASSGGGMLISVHGGVFENLSFKGNTALHFGGAIYDNYYLGDQGGYLNCKFESNHANDAGGGVMRIGGAVAYNQAFINSVFIANTTNGDGGGLYYDSHGSDHLDGVNLAISNSIFSDNFANRGGAVYAEGARDLTSSVGTAYVPGSQVLVRNSSFVGNYSNSGGDAFFRGVSNTMKANVSIYNSIVWSPHSKDYAQVFGGGDLLSMNSIISGVETTVYSSFNIDQDPQFVDPESYDFRLMEASPARDFGRLSMLPKDLFDLDHDGNSNENIPYDLMFGPSDMHSGDDIVDVGAFQYRKDCFHIEGLDQVAAVQAGLEAFLAGRPEADLDHDGFLTNTDISILQDYWLGNCD